MSTIWSDALNTQLYNEYAQNYPMYREVGRYLVQLAPIQPGMTVLDLACGTGVVTELIHEQLGDAGQIIGVDLSATMLEVARQKSTLQRVSFYQSPAEELSTLLGAASVDLVLCNSAFWHMNTSATLAALATILKPGGAFLFNRPERPQFRQQTFIYNLVRGMFEIARNEYNYTSPILTRPIIPTLRTMSVEQVEATIIEAGFTLVQYQNFGVERTAADIYAFEKIPVVTQHYLPGLDYETRLEILDKSYQRLDPSQSQMANWGFYHLRL